MPRYIDSLGLSIWYFLKCNLDGPMYSRFQTIYVKNPKKEKLFKDEIPEEVFM